MHEYAAKKLPLVLCALSLLIGGAPPAADACTAIRLIAQDHAVVYGRTMEFAENTHSEILMVPRGYKRTGITRDGKDGLKWVSKYASVGANALGLPILIDGLNEKGLGVAALYFPTMAGYAKNLTPPAEAKAIAPWQMGSYLLENFASVADVKAHINDVVIADVPLKAWGFTPPLHYVVYDASGKSIVIEPLGGKLVVDDDPLGVLTNAPSFEWQMTNLRNYVNLSTINPPTRKLGSVVLQSLGQGSGLLGLPGGYSPPSRFVRAALFSHSGSPAKNADGAVFDAFHILNAFDIPAGVVREAEPDKGGHVIAEYTQWTTAGDLTNKRYFFRTYDNSQIREVDLMRLPINGGKLVTLPMDGKRQWKNLTP